MNEYNFRGEWKQAAHGQPERVLRIERTGETWGCGWQSTGGEILSGIGMTVNGNIAAAMFERRAGIGGIGMYRPIGDHRSVSALWSSTQYPDTLGAGIAIRKDNDSDDFPGIYTVRYFHKGKEANQFDLHIEQSGECYGLRWEKGGAAFLHGVGIIADGDMLLAWGSTDVNFRISVVGIDGDTITERQAGTGDMIQKEYTYRRI